MKWKLMTALLLGFCLSFFSALSAFAVMEDMIEKQKEVDDYVFVQHQDELAEKGITVTHTAPLENTVEIGITPFTEENVSYLQGIFGADMVTIVEGEQAVTLDQTSAPLDTETPVENSATKSLLYILAGILVLAGLVLALMMKKRRTAI